MTTTNIYLTGVGGQGIGLLSDVLSRALCAAGYPVIGSDTHGLAQRGGKVVSHLRISPRGIGPVIPPHGADFVLALERLEALRAARDMLKPGGHLIHCEVEVQPIAVRMGADAYPTDSEIERAVRLKRGTRIRVDTRGLFHPQHQNTALMAAFVQRRLIDGLTPERVAAALEQILPLAAWDANREILYREQGRVGV